MAPAPAPAPVDLLEPVAFVEAGGTSLAEAKKNATKKQYDFTFTLNIQEQPAGKPYFDNTLKYTGLSYAAMVAIEDGLLKLLGQLTNIGEAVAIGEVPPGQIGPT